MIKIVLFYLAIFLNIQLIIGQGLSKIDSANLLAIVKEIEVDSTYRNGNWNSLLRKLQNKRIVLLGEFNHGSKEVFDSRNDLIKQLHEQLGFNIILFESGMGGLAAVEKNKEKLSPKLMTTGLFWGWRTQEFKELMAYVQERDIAVAGFDVQRSGGISSRFLKSIAKEHQIDPEEIKELEQRFGPIKKRLSNRKTPLDSIKTDVETLIADYERIKTLFDTTSTSTLDDYFEQAKRTLKNRINILSYFLEFRKDNDWHKRWKARDLAMANNVEWLLENIFPNQKVIIIAHNFHISRFSEKEEVMGEFLKAKYGDDMYALGVFAEKGSYVGNYGDEKNLIAPSREGLDIKHIIHELPEMLYFLDIRSAGKEKNSWLHKKIIINDTFIDLTNTNHMILSKHFDGLLLLKEVSPPQRLAWE